MSQKHVKRFNDLQTPLLTQTQEADQFYIWSIDGNRQNNQLLKVGETQKFNKVNQSHHKTNKMGCCSS